MGIQEIMRSTEHLHEIMQLLRMIHPEEADITKARIGLGDLHLALYSVALSATTTLPSLG